MSEVKKKKQHVYKPKRSTGSFLFAPLSRAHIFSTANIVNPFEYCEEFFFYLWFSSYV